MTIFYYRHSCGHSSTIDDGGIRWLVSSVVPYPCPACRDKRKEQESAFDSYEKWGVKWGANG